MFTKLKSEENTDTISTTSNSVLEAKQKRSNYRIKHTPKQLEKHKQRMRLKHHRIYAQRFSKYTSRLTKIDLFGWKGNMDDQSLSF